MKNFQTVSPATNIIPLISLLKAYVLSSVFRFPFQNFLISTPYLYPCQFFPFFSSNIFYVLSGRDGKNSIPNTLQNQHNCCLADFANKGEKKIPITLWSQHHSCLVDFACREGRGSEGWSQRQNLLQQPADTLVCEKTGLANLDVMVPAF